MMKDAIHALMVLICMQSYVTIVLRISTVLVAICVMGASALDVKQFFHSIMSS